MRPTARAISSSRRSDHLAEAGAISIARGVTHSTKQSAERRRLPAGLGGGRDLTAVCFMDFGIDAKRGVDALFVFTPLGFEPS